jgi:hypothetical protein
MGLSRPALMFAAPLLLMAALGLAACNPATIQGLQAPAAQPAAEPAAEPAPATAAGPAQAAQPEPEPEPEAAEPMTRERASATCWTRYDRSRASLDARMKLVDKCIDERMQAGR